MEAVINKYQQGKIYTIRSPHTEKYYIGSTIEKYLSSRFNGHNSNYKRFLKGTGCNITSFKILELGDAYIELLEYFPCNSKLELHKKEGELIREHKNNCVNRCIAGRTKQEYREANKDKIKQKNKTYQEANNDKIKQNKKEYHEANKDKIKEYRETNKEINQIVCVCGVSISKKEIKRHSLTKRHSQFIKEQQAPA